MTVYYLSEKMGSGKTLFSTYYALLFRELYPKAKIYANYKIKTTNFIYSPLLALPLSEIAKSKRSLIIIDDCKALKDLEYFSTIIASLSRKTKTDIILTGQYYTMIKKETRTLSDYKVKVNYIKELDILEVCTIDIEGINEFYRINNIVANVGKYYDTNEIVEFSNENKIKKEILKYSLTIDDLESNLQLFIKNRNTYKRLLKECCIEKGYIS